MPLHVLHVIGTPTLRPFGGTPVKLLYQIAHSPDDIRFTVCCVEAEGELAPQFREHGCEVIALGKSRNYDLTISTHIARIVRDHDVDIIHTHFARASIYGRLAALLTRTPTVMSDHGILANMAWPVVLLDNLLNPFTDARIANSEATALAVRERVWLGTSNLQVIHNGIPDVPAPSEAPRKVLRPDWAVTPDAFLVVSVGSHIPMRDHITTVKAVAHLRKKIPEIRAILVGNGPSHTQIRQAVDLEGVADIVHLPGRLPRDEVHQLLHAADVFVNASHVEAFGIATVEAMLSRLPVVCTNGGSLPELIDDGVEGLMFSPGDGTALVSHIERLSTDSALGKSLGTKARRRALSQFSVHSFASAFSNVYRRISSRGTQ